MSIGLTPFPLQVLAAETAAAGVKADADAGVKMAADVGVEAADVCVVAGGVKISSFFCFERC